MPPNLLTPYEITDGMVKSGCKKCDLKFGQVIWLAVLAGMFIAFGAFAATMISHSISNTSFAKFASAAVFPVGLMLVVICGAELFTGNNLIAVAFLEKKITLKDLLNNWIWVYMGNFIGAMVVVLLIMGSGLLNTSGGVLGGLAIKTALGKVNLTFTQVLIRAVLCNMLVALAVWMATAAQDIIGKIWACWFPIMLFVLSGFEHCIANMYFIPIGILAKGNTVFTSAGNIAAEKLATLNWESFIFNNLIPATIGNILGGAFIIGGIYWYVYKKCETMGTTKVGVTKEITVYDHAS